MFLERPEISIILLTYNRPAGFRKAVESVFSQTFTKFELIILDNGSPEDYASNISYFLESKSNLRYINFEKNTPYIGIRLNQGLTLANGKYITFLTDDDIWYPYTLKTLYDSIQNGTDLVYGRSKPVSYNSARIPPVYMGTLTWRKDYFRGEIFHITSTIISRDLFNKVGGFNEDLKRCYALDLWNRMLYDDCKFERIDKVVSEVTIGNPDSVTLNNKFDYYLTNLKNKPHPLIGYWSNRKSISFSGECQSFVNQINSRNQSWVATTDSIDTDVIMSCSYFEYFDNYPGDILYSLNNPRSVDDRMISKSKGVVSQFGIDLLKPHHLLRPTLSKEILAKIDKIPHHISDRLTILCLDINHENLDFIHTLLNHVADKFKKICLLYQANPEVLYSLKGIKNISMKELEEDSLEYLKNSSVDVILYINGDAKSYTDAYKNILLSATLKTPLISSPNIAYDNIINVKEDILIADTTQGFLVGIVKLRDIKLKESFIKNLRRKIFLYFLDSVVLDKFILFLNDNHKDIKLKVLGNVLLEQNDSNANVIIHTGEHITQSFTVRDSSFNAIQFYGSVLSNTESNIRFVLKLNNDIITEKIIPNFKLKNGENTVLFDTILLPHDNLFTFTLYGETPIFKLDYNNVVMSAGTYFSNNIPKKACLKFKILNDAHIVNL